jgi:hypothetical protein
MELVEGMRVTRVFAPATSFFAKALHRASPLSADCGVPAAWQEKAPLWAGLEVLGVVQINDNSSMSVQCGPSMTHKGRPGRAALG